ncbi:MAG: (2Fe-2S)-binding protein, partial [Brevinema sp.]
MADRNDIICSCMNTTYGELQDVIAANPGITVQELVDQTGAGSICGMCIDGSNG